MCVSAMLFLATIKRCASLYCYHCDSTLNSNCQEIWDDTLATNELYYTECNVHDAKFCAKVTGMWGGRVGTYRFCTSQDLGDQCSDIDFPDHDRFYSACTYVCMGDGCNSAVGISSLPVYVLLQLGVVVGLFRFLSG